MKLISIVIPVYNAELFLERCLNSLRNQTYENLEILMIDDGSSDESAQICKRFSETDSRFKYFYQQNSGVSTARNKGIELAQGDYIGFCDSDDWVEPDAYEILYNLAEDNNADVSVFSFIRENGGVQKAINDNEEIHILDSESAIKEMHLCRYYEGHLWNKLFKKHLFENVRLSKDITIFEDALAVCQLFQIANKVVFQDVHKYHYYINPKSAMNGDFKESVWTIQTASKLMVEQAREFYPNALNYAQRTLVKGNYIIARRLCQSRKHISKNDYLRIKQEITQNYDKSVQELFDVKFRIKYRIFLTSRILFTAHMLFALKKRELSNKR